MRRGFADISLSTVKLMRPTGMPVLWAYMFMMVAAQAPREVAQRSVGEMASLRRDGTAPVIVALDYGTVEVLVDSDGGAAESVLATGHGLEVAAGTQIRVLERANRGRELRVRILSGPWQGRIVWVPAQWVQ